MIVKGSEHPWAHDLLLSSLFCLFCFVMMLLDPMGEVGKGELELCHTLGHLRCTLLQPAPVPQASGLAGGDQVPSTLILFREKSFGNNKNQNISLARSPV